MEIQCMDLRSQYTEKEVINYEALHGSTMLLTPVASNKDNYNTHNTTTLTAPGCW